MRISLGVWNLKILMKIVEYLQILPIWHSNFYTNIKIILNFKKFKRDDLISCRSL